MLFGEVELGGLRLRNRLVLAPMTTYSSNPDGSVHEQEVTYYRRRAQSGFGMVMTAACYVHDSGHAFVGQWSCARDSDVPSLRRVADAIHAGGSVACLQIHHGGRQIAPALSIEPVAPSPIPAERPNALTPRALTDPEIEELVDAFGQATRRAREAGYEAIEIHGANTYLLQQFVSPHSNRRTDRWGQDRLLFTKRVVAAVLAAAGPGVAVGYRFSPEELESPGIRWSDTKALIETLLGTDLAFLHISLGDFRQFSLNQEFEGTVLAQVLNQIAGRKPLIGVGSVNTRDDADAVLATGAHLVAVGRAAIMNPDWPNMVHNRLSPNFVFPRKDAAERLVLPDGLVQRILGAPGWFPLEPETE